MPDSLASVRRLVTVHPHRLSSLRELAHANGLALTEAKVAVERLIAHGELIRRGNRYRRPVGEERGNSRTTSSPSK